MVIKNGDFIRLDLTSKIKETGEVFETTYEEVAKESGIYNDKKDYIPLPIVVGGNHLLHPLNEALIGMDEGESKHIEILPDDVFGKRNPILIQMIPLKDFRKEKINPIPGASIRVGDKEGKILTVSSGRVKVDFNHQLAGKVLEYDLTVRKIIKDEKDKIKGMIQLHYNHPTYDIDKTKIEIDGKIAIIELDEITKYDNENTQFSVTVSKFRTAQDIWNNLDIDEVKFVDVFKKPVEKKKEEDKSINDEAPNTDYEVKS
jgi:peptidylprolyl isomerase/FKBP-type peptidyl-prolyl cis-trans isomerase SlyD